MTLTYYATGTASVDNGDTTVTGSGTGWGGDVIMAGDLFMNPAQPEIPPQRIASVTDGTHLELAFPWPGESITADAYEVRFVGIIERSTAQSRRYLEQIGKVANTGIGIDAFGPFADRGVYDAQRTGFAYLSTDGDGDTLTGATVFLKASTDDGDWSEHVDLTGETGPPGLDGEDGADAIAGVWRGAYSDATSYAEHDIVQQEGSSWIAKTSTTGNAPPTIPATSNTWWDLLVQRGEPGAGNGDMEASVYDPQMIAADAFDRANHTGTQDIETIEGLGDAASRNVGTGAGNVAAGDDSRIVAALQPASVPGFLFGLTLSNNTTDATNDIDIAVGKANDDAATDMMVLVSALTKRLDATWAVGSNQGGRDTGSIANGTWHVFLIKRPDTGVVDVLFSQSATAPTMPTNYTLKRRIGSILRESGVIVEFRQDGDYFYRAALAADVAATNPGTSAVTATLSIPAGISVRAMLMAAIIDTTPTGRISLIVSALALTALTPTSSLYNVRTGPVGTGTEAVAAYLEVLSNTSRQVRYMLDASNADIIIRLTTLGWIDHRGRLA